MLPLVNTMLKKSMLLPLPRRLVHRLRVWILAFFCLTVALQCMPTLKTVEAAGRCPTSCGSVTMPYPFSIGGAGCPGLPEYKLNCLQDGGNSSVLLLPRNSSADLQILSILTDSLIVNATNLRGSCSDGTTTSSLSLDEDLPFALSGEDKFSVNGCNSQGNFSGDKGGIKLQWAIQFANASSCDEAKRSSEYACSRSASCKYTNSVPGYNCFCDKEGYSGDGYKLGTGCSDVNECNNLALNTCDQNAVCRNTDGGHECECKTLFKGDGLTSGSGCTFIGHRFRAALLESSTAPQADKPCKGGETKAECHQNLKRKRLLIAGIVSTTLLVFVLAVLFFQWVYKLWSAQKYRPQNFYSANLSRLRSLSGEPARLFTYKELSKAADGFITEREIGTGGYGTVFKGKLPEGTLVAIKKTNQVSNSGAEQFLNEVTILSQVNHRNLVKLMGCCLETEVPMLVYEFISNGTLFDHLQRSETHPLDWGQRLQIAIETAEALTYLHSAAFPPIFHRDVKSTNILLEDDLTVKVTDFGLSRLVPKDVTHVSTVVMGTPGYMDPEYYNSYQVTDKSDVYSFGVVLLELITSLKPVDFERTKVNLAALSILSIKAGQLLEIADRQLTKFPHRPGVLESIHSVGFLAQMCLAPLRENRPSMKEVMEQLLQIREAFNSDKKEISMKGIESDHDCVDIDPSEEEVVGITSTGAFLLNSLGLGSMERLILNSNSFDIDIDVNGR